MKKFFVLLILLCILLLNSYSNQSNFSLSTYFKTGSITRYTHENTKNSILPNITINGNNKLIGESIYFNNLNIDNALHTLLAKVEFTEYLIEKDLTIIYCSSPLVPRSVEIKNEIINLQIATCPEYTIIGWPMILGSF